MQLSSSAKEKKEHVVYIRKRQYMGRGEWMLRDDANVSRWCFTIRPFDATSRPVRPLPTCIFPTTPRAFVHFLPSRFPMRSHDAAPLRP